MKIAFYDMDRTITRRATFGPFLRHVLRRRQGWRVAALPVSAIYGLAYMLRRMDRGKLKDRNLRLFMGRRIDPVELAPLLEGFAEATLTKNSFPHMLERIAADRAEGFRLVLVTASYAFYVEPIARRLGFDDLLATDLVVHEGGGFTPRIAEENCYGPNKITRIKRWMEAEGLGEAAVEIRAYSDHPSDEPMLALSGLGAGGRATAVNPSKKLRRMAAQRGWDVIERRR